MGCTREVFVDMCVLATSQSSLVALPWRRAAMRCNIYGAGSVSHSPSKTVSVHVVPFTTREFGHVHCERPGAAVNACVLRGQPVATLACANRRAHRLGRTSTVNRCSYKRVNFNSQQNMPTHCGQPR